MKSKKPATENSISVSVEETTKTVDNKHLSLFLHRMGINMWERVRDQRKKLKIKTKLIIVMNNQTLTTSNKIAYKI